VGVIGGGFIGQLLYNRKAPLMPIFVGCCVASAAFPIWFIINADLSRISLAFTFSAAFLGGMLSSPPGPNARYLSVSDLSHLHFMPLLNFT